VPGEHTVGKRYGLRVMLYPIDLRIAEKAISGNAVGEKDGMRDEKIFQNALTGKAKWLCPLAT
jgi:hypothetical protein